MTLLFTFVDRGRGRRSSDSDLDWKGQGRWGADRSVDSAKELARELCLSPLLEGGPGTMHPRPGLDRCHPSLLMRARGQV